MMNARRRFRLGGIGGSYRGCLIFSQVTGRIFSVLADKVAS